MISLVLSGGVGSRLWPLSRRNFPKQFADLFESSLFEKTVRRLSRLGPVRVCTGQSMRVLTERSIREAHLPVDTVYYEPQGRNTAPAIALVCKALQNEGRTDEILGVFPSDHWIEDELEFGRVVSLAEDVASQGYIVTLGLKPTYPATGFGYIERKSDVVLEKEGLEAFEVASFREKPDAVTAQSFLDEGRFTWNSGMFIFRVATMIEAFQTYMPDLWNGLMELESDLSNIAHVFPSLPAESIDYGIMEKFPKQANIPCHLGWNDLGSWEDVSAILESKGTSGESKNFSLKSSNCFGLSTVSKPIAFSNVDDLIVVDTEDATLVTKKGAGQDVKALFDMVEKQQPELTHDHVFEKRPWGLYRNLWQDPDCKVKVIHVDPKQQLSYQSHEKRAEIWVVVSGEGEVVLNDKIIPVRPGSLIEVPLGAKHRMRNLGDETLKFVEVQRGEYFGEDDITRYEDDYKRI